MSSFLSEEIKITLPTASPEKINLIRQLHLIARDNNGYFGSKRLLINMFLIRYPLLHTVANADHILSEDSLTARASEKNDAFFSTSLNIAVFFDYNFTCSELEIITNSNGKVESSQYRQ